MDTLTDIFQNENIDESNYRYYFANKYAYLIGGIAHLLFIPIFYQLNLMVLMVYNFFSVLAFTLSFVLNRKGYHALSTLPATIEVMVHAILTVYFIGWESGFFYYTLAIIPMVFSVPTISSVQKIILTLLVSIFFVSLKYFSNTHIPLVQLDENLLHTIYYANSFFMIISIAALVHYSGLGSKITEDKIGKERQKANTENEAKSIFLANMSHELRTPLNAIIGYSEMLKDDSDEQGLEQNSKDLAKITRAGNHLVSLIDSVLDLTKIESGKMPIEYQPVDISPLINEVISTIRPMVEKENNTLIINCDDDYGYACIDSIKVKQIFFNLLSNACKFTKNGEINLNVYKEKINNKEWFCFRIVDTGIGIPEDKIDVLFQPFMQAEISTTRLYGGTGLGLTITKHFITLMQGTIKVESELDKGSSFLVKIPTAQKNCQN